MKSGANNGKDTSALAKLWSAIFYGVVSMAVIFINKIVLTNYKFHYFYFLAASQFVSTAVILLVLYYMRKIEIPPLSRSIVREVAPVSLLFFGNVICGLGSTKSLNLPMFTVLRRFSILMTMIGEYFVLSSTPSSIVMVSVFLMIFGAIVAAMNDFSFDLYGYILVLLNDLFTALNGVYLKKASSSATCSKMGVLFYNSAFSFAALLLYFLTEEFQTIMFSLSHPSAALRLSGGTLSGVLSFEGWAQWDFCLLFVLAALMGSILNYAIFLCTSANSALTTAVVGCLKNVLVTYCSMLLLSDYTFNLLNFVGLNVSIFGSVIYTYVAMKAG
jgi:solute carrier family 35